MSTSAQAPEKTSVEQPREAATAEQTEGVSVRTNVSGKELQKLLKTRGVAIFVAGKETFRVPIGIIEEFCPKWCDQLAMNSGAIHTDAELPSLKFVIEWMKNGGRDSRAKDAETWPHSWVTGLEEMGRVVDELRIGPLIKRSTKDYYDAIYRERDESRPTENVGRARIRPAGATRITRRSDFAFPKGDWRYQILLDEGRCLLCCRKGHVKWLCPNPKATHGKCWDCLSPTHWAKDCPQNRPPPPAPPPPPPPPTVPQHQNEKEFLKPIKGSITVIGKEGLKFAFNFKQIKIEVEGDNAGKIRISGSVSLDAENRAIVYPGSGKRGGALTARDGTIVAERKGKGEVRIERPFDLKFEKNGNTPDILKFTGSVSAR